MSTTRRNDFFQSADSFSSRLTREAEPTNSNFYGGLGEDAGENTLTLTTPSGVATRQSSGTDWGAVVAAALPTALSVYQQKELSRLNMARIQAGRAMLTADDYAAYRVPAAEVQIGASPQARDMLMYAGLGVLGLVALRAAKII